MAKKLVKEIFAWTCDFCGAYDVGSERPAGWKNGVLRVHGCGMTDYTRHEHADVCASCPSVKDV
jgi:hypothetical protein